MRIVRVLIAIWLVILFAGIQFASAHDVQQGDKCVIEPNSTITGNLFVLCRTLTINGHINGNLIGAATSATINGQIDGNIYLLAGQLDMNGTVGENLHYAGLVLKLNDGAKLESPRSDLIAVSLSTNIAPTVTIPASLLDLGYQLTVDGKVGGETSFWGSSLTVDGTLTGNIEAQVGDSNADVSQLQGLLIPFPIDLTLNQPGLHVNEGAHVAGRLHYSGPTEGEIAPNTLAQDVVYTPVLVQPDLTQIALGEQDQSRGLSIYLAQVVREFLTLGIIGLIGLLLVPRALQAPQRNLAARPLPCLGVGMLSFIISFVAVPFVILLTILVVVAVGLLQVNELTISIGTILGVIDVGGTSVLFFVVIFVSRVVLCLALGRVLIHLLLGDDRSPRAMWLGLLVGVALLAIVASLPVIGWIINAIAAFLGLGAILIILQSRVEAARDATATPRIVTVSPPTMPRRGEDPRLVPPPPPILDDNPQPPGMGNLPDGFKWWEDE